MKNHNKNGGSLASDYVMAIPQKVCGDSFGFPETPKTGFSFREIIQNYGSEYKTTGGGRRNRHVGGAVDVEGFVNTLAGNRVLDLYLKYLGITLLTPATLVPIALIMGKQTFEQVVRDMKRNDRMVQSGGEGFLDVKVPIVDDEIVGNALKLAGLTAVNISPYTLVPLGVIMYVYDKYLKEIGQKGGGIATILPMEYFGRKSCQGLKGGYPYNNLDTPQLREEVFGYKECAPVDHSGIQRPYSENSCQKGGEGCGINPNLDWLDVKDTFVPHEQVDNSGIQRPYSGGGSRNKRRNSNKKQRGGNRTPFGSDVPPNLVQQATARFTGQDVQFPRGDVYDNRDMQLTNTIPSQSDYRPPYAEQIETPILPDSNAYCASTGDCARLPQAMAGGNRKKNNKRGGASSDWISTVYSRGPVNTIDMDPNQFAMFNKTSPYITNRLLNGDTNASDRFYNFSSYADKLDYKPLYLEDVPVDGPQPNQA